VFYSVLTPPPGFYDFRKIQSILFAKGHALALALPPLVVLGEGIVEPFEFPLGNSWSLGANGLCLGEVNPEPVNPMPFLKAENAWVICPWDRCPCPELKPPEIIPQKKFTWGIIQLDSNEYGIQWKWLEQKAFKI